MTRVYLLLLLCSFVLYSGCSIPYYEEHLVKDGEDPYSMEKQMKEERNRDKCEKEGTISQFIKKSKKQT